MSCTYQLPLEKSSYRAQAPVTSVGVINLHIPKLRSDSHFPKDLFTHCSRVDRSVIAEVSEDGDLRHLHGEGEARFPMGCQALTSTNRRPCDAMRR